MYLVAVVMTLLGALGAFFFKQSAMKSGNMLSLLTNYRLYLGGGFYVAGALLNILLLHYMEYSVVYPMTATTYIWTLLLSNRLLGESITIKKLTGILLICTGLFILVQ